MINNRPSLLSHTGDEFQFLLKLLKLSVVIEGWEPVKNLRIDHYINPKRNITLSTGINVCPANGVPFAVVLVSSTAENQIARKAIRETWAQNSYNYFKISVAFFIGVSEENNIDVALNLLSVVNLYRRFFYFNIDPSLLILI